MATAAADGAAGRPVLWRPWPGRQTEFLAASEFEVLFGGAKGPGKSDCLLMAATRQVDKPRYKALILRESFPEVQELIDRSKLLFPKMTGAPTYQEQPHRWTWPSGASLTFGFCSTPDDVGRYQGQEWAYIGFDELGNVADERVWTLLMAECRCPDPTVVRMMRGSANPGKAGHPWIKRRFISKCGMDGRTVHVETVEMPNGLTARLTRRYIPARVTDNPVYANDPLYMAQLWAMPEVLRRQLLYGDWNAGTGLALDELEPTVHLVKPFQVPRHWVQFGAFDWGYAHPWVFGHFAANEDGRVFLVDTVRGRRDRPDEIAHAINEQVPVGQLSYIVAGHDVNADHKARGEHTPTIAETLQQHGIITTPASISRRAGLNNLRWYVSWRGRGPDGEDDDPAFVMMDTPGNRWALDQLQSMMTDEDDPENVLKVNADPVTGEGGDDAYDMIRYGLASRPMKASSLLKRQPVRAFSREALHYQTENQLRDKQPDEARTQSPGAAYLTT